jgi:excisionase family DNA binding protein
VPDPSPLLRESTSNFYRRGGECVVQYSKLLWYIKGSMRLKDLESHTEPYVTVAELAEYWLVGRKQIYKQIDAGTLPAIRLGPRLLRIRTSDAREFERLANMRPPATPPRERFISPSSRVDRVRRAR